MRVSNGIDIRAARTHPGVTAVYTAADLEAAGVQGIPSLNQSPPFALINQDGSAVPLADQYPLAQDKVRYVGEPVAFVIAESLAAARDAAESIELTMSNCPR